MNWGEDSAMEQRSKGAWLVFRMHGAPMVGVALSARYSRSCLYRPKSGYTINTSTAHCSFSSKERGGLVALEIYSGGAQH